MLDFGYTGKQFKGLIFLTLAEETTQKRRYFLTGFRFEYPMPVFYFLTKFKIQSENFRIAK
jgi:hypothetical protein